MQTEARITARSQRQAMDWSLALISQGIGSTVVFTEEDRRWGLLVELADYEKAVAVIRQYRIENSFRRWRRQELRPGIIFDWGSLAWLVLLLFFYMLDDQAGLRERGHFSSQLFDAGQWWRLFTAVWLHADLGHLAMNAVTGTVLLGLVMGRHGTGVGMLASYLAGAAGNVFAWTVAPATHRSLGASGMVMGCLGLLAIESAILGFRGAPSAFRTADRTAEVRPSPGQRLRWALSGTAAGVMLFVLLGLSPTSDVLAHFGGFLGGLVLGGLLAVFRDLPTNGRVNVAAGAMFALLTIVPWLFALRGATGARTFLWTFLSACA